MRNRPALRCLLVLFCLAAAPALAQWTPVSSGVDYREWTLTGPVRAFVVRMSRADPTLVLDSAIAKDQAVGAKEVVSAQATGRRDTVTYWNDAWGFRRDVLAAVNGDFFDLTTGVPPQGEISGGWYLKRYPEFGGYSGLVFGFDRSIFLGGCVRHIASKQVVTWANGTAQDLDGVNVPRGANQLVLYTPHFDADTGTDGTGVEVVLALARPAGLVATPGGVQGTVVEVRNKKPAIPVEFDRAVLSATGTAAQTLLNQAQVGGTVKIAQELTNLVPDCSGSAPESWDKTYTSIGGNFRFLVAGQTMPTTNAGLTNLAPRTALAFNANYLYAVVVDGRSTASVGMNMTQLADFCRTELGATDGLNQDGGGSSTMWLSGKVKNVPSDGAERPVANTLIIARLLPPERSTRLGAGQSVKTTASTSLRLGPGTDYPARATLASGATGTVLAHPVGGVRGTSKSWWRMSFSSGEGWVDESALQVPDAGASDAGAPDAGAPDAGAPDAGSGGSDDVDGGSPNPWAEPEPTLGGCGCATTEASAALAWLWVLGLGLRATRSRTGSASR